MEEFSFLKLNVYQDSKQLVCRVYELIRRLPSEERFALAQQLQRAVVSIPSNIAEGCGRCSLKEKIHFLEIAYGSLLETYCQLDVAVSLGYLSAEELASIRPKFYEVSRQLSGLKNSYTSKLPAK